MLRFRPNPKLAIAVLIIVSLGNAVEFFFDTFGGIVIALLFTAPLIIIMWISLSAEYRIENGNFVVKMPTKGELAFPIDKIKTVRLESKVAGDGFTFEVDEEYLLREAPNVSLFRGSPAIIGGLKAEELSQIISEFKRVNPQLAVEYSGSKGALRALRKEPAVASSAVASPAVALVEAPKATAGFTVSYSYKPSGGMHFFILPGVIGGEDKPGFAELVKELNFLKKIRAYSFACMMGMLIVPLILGSIIRFGLLSGIMGLVGAAMVYGASLMVTGYKMLKIHDRYGADFNIVLPYSVSKFGITTPEYMARGQSLRNHALLDIVLGAGGILFCIYIIQVALLLEASGYMQ